MGELVMYRRQYHTTKLQTSSLFIVVKAGEMDACLLVWPITACVKPSHAAIFSIRQASRTELA